VEAQMLRDAESVPRAVASVAPEVGYWRESRSLPLAVLIKLNETGGNLSQTAEGLKMSLPGLKKAIKRLGIR